MLIYYAFTYCAVFKPVDLEKIFKEIEKNPKKEIKIQTSTVFVNPETISKKCTSSEIKKSISSEIKKSIPTESEWLFSKSSISSSIKSESNITYTKIPILAKSDQEQRNPGESFWSTVIIEQRPEKVLIGVKTITVIESIVSEPKSSLQNYSTLSKTIIVDESKNKEDDNLIPDIFRRFGNESSSSKSSSFSSKSSSFSSEKSSIMSKNESISSITNLLFPVNSSILSSSFSSSIASLTKSFSSLISSKSISLLSDKSSISSVKSSSSVISSVLEKVQNILESKASESVKRITITSYLSKAPTSSVQSKVSSVSVSSIKENLKKDDSKKGEPKKNEGFFDILKIPSMDKTKKEDSDEKVEKKEDKKDEKKEEKKEEKVEKKEDKKEDKKEEKKDKTDKTKKEDLDDKKTDKKAKDDKRDNEEEIKKMKEKELSKPKRETPGGINVELGLLRKMQKYGEDDQEEPKEMDDKSKSEPSVSELVTVLKELPDKSKTNKIFVDGDFVAKVENDQKKNFRFEGWVSKPE